MRATTMLEKSRVTEGTAVKLAQDVVCDLDAQGGNGGRMMPLGTHRASRAGGSAAALDPARPIPGAEAKNETSPLPSTGYARIFLMT